MLLKVNEIKCVPYRTKQEKRVYEKFDIKLELEIKILDKEWLEKSSHK